MRRTLIALVLVSATAAAEPVPKHKSLGTALAWSLGVTALGIAAGIAAPHAGPPGEQFALMSFSGLSLLVGPSIGRFETGNYVTAGIVTRTVGVTVVVMSQALGCMPGPTPPGRAQPACGAKLDYNGVTYLGAGIMALGALWDLLSIPEDFERDNARATLAPIALRTPSGVVPGLALAGDF